MTRSRLWSVLLWTIAATPVLIILTAVTLWAADAY
jgi:hypothetical protein